jgi:hypothetical protein
MEELLILRLSASRRTTQISILTKEGDILAGTYRPQTDEVVKRPWDLVPLIHIFVCIPASPQFQVGIIESAGRLLPKLFLPRSNTLFIIIILLLQASDRRPIMSSSY